MPEGTIVVVRTAQTTVASYEPMAYYKSSANPLVAEPTDSKPGIAMTAPAVNFVVAGDKEAILPMPGS